MNGEIEAIAASVAAEVTTKDEALAKVVEAMDRHGLSHLDVVPLAEAVERLTGLQLVPRFGDDR